MKSNEIESILLFLPLCLGMLGAFLAAKKGNIKQQHFRKQSMAESLGHAYLVGNLYFIISFFLISLILAISSMSFVELGGILALVVLLTGFATVLSFVLGLIIYLPCAFFGYNLYARKLAEEEIARTQLQILKEIEAEKSSEQQGVSKE